MSAQAWHWIQPGIGVRQAAAVLGAAGRVALFWNRGGPPAHVAERLRPIYAALEPEVERYSVLLHGRDDRTAATVADLTAEPRLAAVAVQRFPWTAAYDTSSWIEFLQTHSDHRALPPERHERLFTAVAEQIDTLGGTFEVSYETVLVSARRAGTAAA